MKKEDQKITPGEQITPTGDIKTTPNENTVIGTLKSETTKDDKPLKDLLESTELDLVQLDEDDREDNNFPEINFIIV